MTERLNLIWFELEKQCAELNSDEFEYFWEMWGVMWMPWFIMVEFFELMKITITSFEVSNYEILVQNLKNVTKSYFKLHTENKTIKSYQGYGWLIFLIILTFGLVFSLIQKNLGN